MRTLQILRGFSHTLHGATHAIDRCWLMPRSQILRRRVQKLRCAIAAFRKLEVQVKLLRRGSIREVAADQITAIAAMHAASIEVLIKRLAAVETDLIATEAEEAKKVSENLVAFPDGMPLTPHAPVIPLPVPFAFQLKAATPS